MNEIILRDEIMTLLADRNDRAALERVYALLKPYFEKKEGTKPKRQLVLTEWQQECIDRAIGKGLIERLPDGEDLNPAECDVPSILPQCYELTRMVLECAKGDYNGYIESYDK